MARRMMARKTIDIDDEDAVREEMADALDIDPDELHIQSSHLEDFGVGTVLEVTLGRGGHREWCVVQGNEQADELATAIVRQDLETEPEIFNKDFIEQHINTDRLRQDLRSDVVESISDSLIHTDTDDFWRQWEQEGFEAPEEDEEGELPEPENYEIEELAERLADEQLKDPMQYLEDIYGDEAAAKAIEIAGIDIDAAADEAVDTDGAGHFLSSYDGQTHETAHGLVYWRTN